MSSKSLKQRQHDKSLKDFCTKAHLLGVFTQVPIKQWFQNVALERESEIGKAKKIRLATNEHSYHMFCSITMGSSYLAQNEARVAIVLKEDMGSVTDDDGSFTENVVAHTYAPSLPVANVQEMVKEDPVHVPERYVRSQEDRPRKNDMSHLSSQISVIDLSQLSVGDTKELHKLDLACQEWGFFQVVNHGVAKEVLQSMKKASSAFFELPLEEKNKYAMHADDIQGYGHAYVVSEEQILDWSDALMLTVYPTQYRQLKFWPSEQGFREIIDAYSKAIKSVGEQLLCSVSTIMGMDQAAFPGLRDGLQALRVNYYPLCNRPGDVLGISPHSDVSTITILMQEDDVSGLQIKHNGGWVLVKPIVDALVVNVGDVLEILSNGKYKSIEHRAVTNENKARLSYASFICPLDDVEIEPLEHLQCSQKTQRVYKKVKFGDYLRSSMKRKMEGKAHVEMAKVEA